MTIARKADKDRIGNEELSLAQSLLGTVEDARDIEAVFGAAATKLWGKAGEQAAQLVAIIAERVAKLNAEGGGQ